MMLIELCVPISKHNLRLLEDDKYYRRHYQKDYETFLGSVTFPYDNEIFNVLVMLCFGSRDGNAWIDITLWKKVNGVFIEVIWGEPMHNVGSSEMTYDDLTVNVSVA